MKEGCAAYGAYGLCCSHFFRLISFSWLVAGPCSKGAIEHHTQGCTVAAMPTSTQT